MKDQRKVYEQKLADKLKELKTAREETWKLARAGTEEIWIRAKAAYDNADSQFK